MSNIKKNNFISKLLKERFRITFFHDDFKPVFSLRFTIFTLILWLIGYAAFMIIITIFIISKTTLKEYITGHEDTKEKKQIITFINKIDSLQITLNNKSIYIQGILNAINGNKDSASLQKPHQTQNKKNELSVKANKNESAFRKEIEQEWAENKNIKMNTTYNINNQEPVKFVPPTLGIVISEFNPSAGHNGIDIVTKNEEPVRSIDKGIIVSSGYSSADGNFVIIMHPNGFVSVYKHLSVILKNAGVSVNSGDMIGNSGDTGSESHGTHLHFELWYKNKSVDPNNYILF